MSNLIKDSTKALLPLRLGSRGSLLAVRQAELVAQKICQVYGLAKKDVQLVSISTKGDRLADRSIAELGMKGQGVFVRELENALLRNTIDIAVHSLKDMPSILPDSLHIAAVLPRDDVRDAIICKTADSIEKLPYSAKVGTSSVRRAAQLLRYRPDVQVVSLRGNLSTRIRAVSENKICATFLAQCGLDRLANHCDYANPIDISIMLPAAAQAIIAVEINTLNEALREMLAPINDSFTMDCAIAERECLAQLGGGCSLPVAANARLLDEVITLQAEIYSHDGSKKHRVKGQDLRKNAALLGKNLGQQMLSLTGGNIANILVQ